MANAIWSGSLSFGLVNVPVKAYTAVRSQQVRFHQLHNADGVRLKQKRYCPADGEEVAYDDIVSGYEIAPDRYVVIDNDELRSVDPDATRAIDVEDFVALDEIDPMFFDRPYWLAPDKGAGKAYAVLRDAMAATGKVAIGRVVLRTKQYLVAVRDLDGALVMATMRFADEVVSQRDIPGLPLEGADAESEGGAKTAKATEREEKMARQLIEALSTDFDASAYADDHRARLLEMIERKAEGEEIAVQPESAGPAPVLDLIAALEASLQAAQSPNGSGSSEKDEADEAPAKKKAPARRKSASRKAA